MGKGIVLLVTSLVVALVVSILIGIAYFFLTIVTGLYPVGVEIHFPWFAGLVVVCWAISAIVIGLAASDDSKSTK